MTDPIVLTLSRDIAASPARVFDAWLDPAIAAKFLFATADGEMLTVNIDARVGGRALIIERRPQGDAEHHLVFEVIDRPHCLIFKFRACIGAVGAHDDEWTRVSLAFAPQEIDGFGSGTRLKLTHEMAHEWAAYEQRTQEGWTMILFSLARQLEADHG